MDPALASAVAEIVPNEGRRPGTNPRCPGSPICSEMRRGVGQKRTEAPAPTPIPSPRGSSGWRCREPSRLRLSRLNPLRVLGRPPSRLPGHRNRRTKPPETRRVPPVKGGKPSPSASSGQRVRRIAIPERRQRPLTGGATLIVFHSRTTLPARQAETSLGHQFGQFTRRAHWQLLEHRRTFVRGKLPELWLESHMQGISRTRELWTQLKDCRCLAILGVLLPTEYCTGGARATVAHNLSACLGERWLSVMDTRTPRD